jgi:two-component system, response regulator YesN
MRVMVVEDEQLVCRGLILTTDWQKMGCEVIAQASNGLEGKEIAQKLKPDIIITDVRMPGMDGIEMIREIRKSNSDSEFIVISGYSEFEYAHNAIQLGVSGFLVKPIDDDDLEQAIARARQNIYNKHMVEIYKKNDIEPDSSRMQLLEECNVSPACFDDIDYVSRAVRYIADNYENDITLRHVANQLYISESYLSRLFKLKMGKTFGDYLTYFRIKKACSLLKDHNIKIYKIAQLVGYKDQRYFSVIFKKLVGMTPKEFRNNFE